MNKNVIVLTTKAAFKYEERKQSLIRVGKKENVDSNLPLLQPQRHGLTRHLRPPPPPPLFLRCQEQDPMAGGIPFFVNPLRVIQIDSSTRNNKKN